MEQISILPKYTYYLGARSSNHLNFPFERNYGSYLGRWTVTIVDSEKLFKVLDKVLYQLLYPLSSSYTSYYQYVLRKILWKLLHTKTISSLSILLSSKYINRESTSPFLLITKPSFKKSYISRFPYAHTYTSLKQQV